MGTLVDVLQWAQNLMFLAVAVWALLRWRAGVGEAGRWLAATFGSLSAVIAIGLVSEAFGVDPPEVVGRISIVGLTVFPYLLLRFLDSFEAVPKWFRGGAAVTTVLASLVVLVLPSLPEEGEPWPPLFAGYVVVLTLLWVVVLPTVAARFWRAGRGQPTLVRWRLRVLSLGALTLSLALLLVVASGASGAEEPDPVFTLVVQVIALASAGSFLVGFAPPALLRSLWRQPEEHRLHQASVHLMAAASPDEVAQLLVPHVREVMAAEAAALVHREEVLAVSGFDGLAGTAEGDEHVDVESIQDLDAPITFDLTAGRLHLWPNNYTPFFGAEELALLERLAVLTDLALARTGLLVREQDARVALEAANKELESFVYSASHDLKSPLIAIQSYLDVLTEELGEDLTKDAAWYVERMRRNAGYMEALVGDLLELSRVGRVETAPDVVDLDAVVAEVAREVEDRFPDANVTVGELPDMWMNPLRCRQLFRNLVENAASHADGPVHVTVEVGVPDVEDEAAVLLLVRDDGTGIPAEYREQVFGVFERLHADGGGDRKSTGIGLAICKKIVEGAGGRIWVTDHEDGAEFAVLFPAEALADTTHESKHEVHA